MRAKNAHAENPLGNIGRQCCQHCWGWGFAELIFRRFLFLKILEQMQACLSAQRYHDGRSHALLEYVGLAAIVWCAVCSRKRRWNGVPPRVGPFGRRRFFRRFSAHFCVTLEHLFFKRRRKLRTKNQCKNGRKKGRKNLRTKNLRKNPVWTFRLSGRWKPEKKTQKKICAKLAQNPSPKQWNVETACVLGCVLKTQRFRSAFWPT